jgi:hypothetical protein
MAWATTLLTTTLITGVLASPASAAPRRPIAAAVAAPTYIGLLGDVPYGASQRTKMPSLIKKINADSQISLVLHVGDTKSGTEKCLDSFYTDRWNLFNTFQDPFVLTPGDNDWTDCHTVSAGSYVPTERLAHLRGVWYPVAGQSMGVNKQTFTSQATADPNTSNQTYRENVRFTESGVVIATFHIVGSSNGLASWSDLPGGDQPTVRKAEYNARRQANLAWINSTFDAAAASGAPGVVLVMQAEPTSSSAFSQERSLILSRAKTFKKPVLLVHGDAHVYTVTKNYGGVANLTRLETYGSTTGHWLKVTIDPSKTGMSIFSWVSMTGV